MAFDLQKKCNCTLKANRQGGQCNKPKIYEPKLEKTGIYC